MDVTDALDQLDLVAAVAVEAHVAAGRVDNTDEARLDWLDQHRDALATVLMFVSGDTNNAAPPTPDPHQPR